MKKTKKRDHSFLYVMGAIIAMLYGISFLTGCNYSTEERRPLEPPTEIPENVEATKLNLENTPLNINTFTFEGIRYTILSGSSQTGITILRTER